MILLLKNDKAKSVMNINENKKDDIAMILYPLHRGLNNFYLLASPNAILKPYKKFKLKYSVSLFAGTLEPSVDTDAPIARYGKFADNISVETSDLSIFLNAIVDLISLGEVNSILNNPFESGTFYTLYQAHDVKIEVEYQNGTKEKFKTPKLSSCLGNSNEIYDVNKMEKTIIRLNAWLSRFLDWDALERQFNLNPSSSVIRLDKKKWFIADYQGFINDLSQYVDYDFSYTAVMPWIFHESDSESMSYILGNLPATLDILVYDEIVDTNSSQYNELKNWVNDAHLEGEMGDLYYTREYVENCLGTSYAMYDSKFDMYTEYLYFAKLLLVSNILTEMVEYGARNIYGAEDPHIIYTLLSHVKKKNHASSTWENTRSEFLFSHSKYISLNNYAIGSAKGDLVTKIMEVYSL